MSRTDRTDRACLAAALLVAGAVAVVAASAPRRAPAEAAGADLQRLVGGIGAGTALDLSRCAFGFDPRVGTVCDGRHELLPGGGALCPRHAGLLP
jgi:hypothetical protein